MRSIVLVLLILVPASAPDAAPTTGSASGKVIVTRNGKEFRREFVYAYLVRKRVGRHRPTTVKAKIAQKNKTFEPRVQVVPLRSQVAFPNEERSSENHNVFSPTEPRFDLETFAPGASKDQEFEFEGEFDIYCDIHLNMTAKVKVVDSDHIVRVVDGAFTLTDVPAGEYKLHVWTPNTTEVTESVTIVAGQATALPHVIKLPLKSLATPGHKRKDGSAYPACKYSNGQPCKPTDDVW